MARIIVGIALVATAIIFAPFTPVIFGIGYSLSATAFAAVSLAATAALSIGASLIFSGIAQTLQHGVGADIAVRQPAAPWQIVYGRSRIGGVFVYMAVTDNKSLLHMIIVHAAHPCHAFNGYWLDGRQVIFSGGGQSGTADSNDHYDPSGNKYNFKGDVYVEHRLGTESTAAFQSLRSYDSNWPTTATLQGHCCSYIRVRYDQNLWPNGYPLVRVDLAGKSNIYDPRNGTGYTENPALIWCDVLTNTDYGLQCNYSTEIDEGYLISAANACDVAVPLANGGTEPRYSCNGTFDTSMDAGNILKNVLTSCGGRQTVIGGLWRIYPAGWTAPTVSFSDDDFVAPIKWMPRRKYRELANGVRGRFVCPSYPYNQYGPGYPNNQKVSGIFDGQWQACDIPPYAQDSLHGYASDANYAADGNTRLWLDTTFPFTISVATAQRLAKILLLRNRQQGTGTITVGLRGIQCACLDTIYLNHSRFGWSNKIVEITNMRHIFQEAKDGDGVLLYYELDVQETDSSVYNWSTSEELSVEDNPSPVMPGRGIISQATFYPISSANKNSAVVGGASPLTATDTGSSCDINIAAFALQFGFGQVSYSSGVVHGASYSTLYYVYAFDPTLSGGAVTYLTTTDFTVVTSSQGNVFVDSIRTPASGAGGTSGGGTGGGGTPGSETGSFTVTPMGAPPTSYSASWTTSNVPSGNAIQMQYSANGGTTWNAFGYGTGGTASVSATSAGSSPSFRLIDTTSGFVLQ